MKKFNTPREGSGTREWSEHSFNIGVGCEHGCLYCYARANALRFKLVNNNAEWIKPRLNEKVIRKAYGKREGVVMFPTTHDITSEYKDDYMLKLVELLSSGNQVLLVTKAGPCTIQNIVDHVLPFKDNLLIRFSITSLSDQATRIWEPGAPLPSARMDALNTAFKAGIKTSVSAEPFLPVISDNFLRPVSHEYFRNAELLYHAVSGMVTEDIWFGTMNHIHKRMPAELYLQHERDIEILEAFQSEAALYLAYHKLKDLPKIKFKDSIMRIVKEVDA